MGIYSRLVVLALGAWLLVACDSQTSLMCSIVGAGILLSDRIPLLKRTPKLVVLFGLVVVPSLILGLMIYHVGNPIVETLGRDMTFTGRTKIWELVLGLQANPLLGKGFYSFWLGDAAEKMWGEFSTITTAHSGYVETYLDGGYVGVFVLVIALAVVGWKLAGEFLRGTMFGRVRFMFWVMAVMLNFSESSFFRLTPMWLAFLVMALDVPQPAMVPSVVDADEVVVSKATVVA
jgi:O-antigen ligase